jgi:hypothetical protein
MLSLIINKLLHPFLAIITSHMYFNKKVQESLLEIKKCCHLNIFIKKNRFNKKNITIRFTCETNRTKMSVCVVMELWQCRFWLSVPDCDLWVKHMDVTCWMYSTHTTFESYDGLKSLQTATSFQFGRSIFFIYFLAFFCALYNKSHNLYGTK